MSYNGEGYSSETVYIRLRKASYKREYSSTYNDKIFVYSRKLLDSLNKIVLLIRKSHVDWTGKRHVIQELIVVGLLESLTLKFVFYMSFRSLL